MIRVLFLCTGNICRSPMADAVFQHMVDQAGLGEQIQVDSAGTGGWHVGERAHHGTLKVLREHDIPYNGRARQIITADLQHFDYILAMDTSHLRHLERMGKSNAEIKLFMSYANAAQTSADTEVPDPYYDGRFNLVYDLVNKGSRALLDYIQHKHGLQSQP